MAITNDIKADAEPDKKTDPEIRNYNALSSFFDFENAMLQRNIGLFDQKSAVLLACNLAITLYLFTGLNSGGPAAETIAGISLNILTYICIFLFILSSFFTFLAVRPRVSKSDDVVFWGSQAFEQSLDQYLERVKSLEKSKLLEQRLTTSYVLARICKQKFRWLQQAFLTAIMAFSTLILAQCIKLLLPM